MSDFVAPLAVIIRIALIDADHRVLLMQTGKDDDASWDFPGVMLMRGDEVLDYLAAYVQHHYQVTSFAKAFFPLTFDLSEDEDTVTLLYGCRNWTGPNGLQHIQTEQANMKWVKPVRMGDYALAPSCLMMMPTLVTLMGQ